MDVFTDAVRQAFTLLFSGQGYLLEVLVLSVRVSGLAVLLGILFGMPVGIAAGVFRFPGRRLLITLIHTGFALPPVVIGLFVYMLLSRSGPAGKLDLLFTPAAMVLAQSLLAAPYVAGITLASVQSVPADVRLQARALGAAPWYSLWAHVREAKLGLMVAVVAGFGAVISEVGAVMMVGGNILGQTRVMTTAIVLETRRGNFGTALAFGLILLFFAFAINFVLTHYQQRERARRVR
jgi:tungstate transport system permease protein